MRTVLKKRAIKLRRNGYLYAEIGRELGIAKSTAHLWTSGTSLDAKQSEKINFKLRSSRQKKIEKLATINRQRREQRDELLRKQAEEFVKLTKPNADINRLLCAVMFWCEGGKDTQSGIRFINSDPLMISTFLKLLRNSFSLDEMKFRALIHLHEYHDAQQQLKFWSKITRIPPSQFYRPYLKPNTVKNIRDNYPGCISIRYSDNSLGRLLKMVYIEFSRNIGASYNG